MISQEEPPETVLWVSLAIFTRRVAHLCVHMQPGVSARGSPHSSLVLGGEVVAWSLPNSEPAIPRWRESKIVVQSIKQSFLAEGVHLSISLFSQ